MSKRSSDLISYLKEKFKELESKLSKSEKKALAEWEMDGSYDLFDDNRMRNKEVARELQFLVNSVCEVEQMTKDALLHSKMRSILKDVME